MMILVNVCGIALSGADSAKSLTLCALPQVLVSAVALAAFGVTGAMLGGANIYKGGARVVIGGLAAMGITYGFGRIFAGSTAHVP